MIEAEVELDNAQRRCMAALGDWALSEDERRSVLTGGIGSDEPGAAVALETRLRHIVDIDRSVCCLVGRASLVPLWLRLRQDVLAGLTPLEFVSAHQAGLRHLRTLLVRESLERGFQ